MDFSQAQRAAHAEEFADTMVSRVAGWDMLSEAARTAERQAHLDDASDFQQGCEIHFQRSAMRLKKDKAIVPPDLLNTFEVCLHTLLSPGTTLDEWRATMNTLRTVFPPVMKGWIAWYEQPRIAAMIFPACSKNATDFRLTEIPRTSNPIEVQHSLLHHATGKDYDLIPGIEALFRHARQIETQFRAAQGAS